MRRVLILLAVVLATGCGAERRAAPKEIPATPGGPSAASASSSAPPQSPPPLSESADQIVLSLDELNALTGKATYAQGGDMVDSKAPLVIGSQVDPQECAGALLGLQNESVAGSAASSFRIVESVTVGDPSLPKDQRRKDDFIQVAAVYPSAAAAGSVFVGLANSVQACRDKRATETAPAGDGSSGGVQNEVDVAVEAVASDKVRWSQRATKGWAPNQRCVLEARIVNNVVFQDIECGLDVGEFLTQAAGKTAGRIS